MGDRDLHELNDKLKAEGLSTVVTPKQPTASSNLAVYELLKSAAGEHRVHLPDRPLARNELRFLQWTRARVDAPKSGPVQRRDIADCVANVVASLLSDHTNSAIEALRRASVRGAGPRGPGLR